MHFPHLVSEATAISYNHTLEGSLKDLKTQKNSGIWISILPLIKPKPTFLKHLTLSRNHFQL